MNNPLSETKIKSLKQLYNEVDEIKEVISDILDGKGEVTSCEKHGIDVSYFRRFCSMKSKDREEGATRRKDFIDDTLLSWQEAFLKDVYGEYIAMTDDFEDFWASSLTRLTEREKECVKGYYKEGYNSKELSEKFGVCPQRIAQILHNGLRRIRTNEKARAYKVGYKNYDMSNSIKRDKNFVERNYNELLLDYHDFIERLKELPVINKLNLFDESNSYYTSIQTKLKHNGYSIDLQDISNLSFKELVRLGLTDAEFVYLNLLMGTDSNANISQCCSIDSMNLSVRTYNALSRAGYKYVSDLNNISVSQLFKLRNIGRRSITELINRCKELGINVIIDKEI